MDEQLGSRLAVIASSLMAARLADGGPVDEAGSQDRNPRREDREAHEAARRSGHMEQGFHDSSGRVERRTGARQGERRSGPSPVVAPALETMSWKQVRTVAVVLGLTVLVHYAFKVSLWLMQ